MSSCTRVNVHRYRDLATLSNRGIAERKLVLALSLLLLLFFTALYIVLSPDLAYQHWDSLQYAYEAEVNGVRAIRGNHPLGHVILYGAFFLARSVGYEGRALAVFQAANGIIGGITVALFLIVLSRLLKVRPLYAVGFSLVFGASYRFWFIAGTGDIYSISILLSLLTWASFISEITVRGRHFPFASGMLAGLSILSHQLNGTLLPAGIALVLAAPRRESPSDKIRIKQTATLIGAAAIVAVAGYLLLGAIATSSFSLSTILRWMQGYFGDPTYGRYLSAEYVSVAWQTASEAVIAFLENEAGFIRTGLLAFLLSPMPLGLFAYETLDAGKRSILKACALQCFMAWPLITWWEPHNVKFWLLTLLPWLVFLIISFEAVENRLRDGRPEFSQRLRPFAGSLPLLIGILIFSINVRYGLVSPAGDRHEEGLAFYEAMDAWISHSQPDDVLITAGDLVPHLMYWADRPNTVNLYRSLQASQASPDGFDDLRRRIDGARCRRNTVLLAPAAGEYLSDQSLAVAGVSREELRAFFEEYARNQKVAFRYRNLMDGEQVAVYVLRRGESCEKVGN